MENLRATNGPDCLSIWQLTTSEFINLGALKANIGNYDIPEGTDLEKVLIWCKDSPCCLGVQSYLPSNFF